MIDFSLRRPEHADSPFTATLLSEPGGALRLQEHSIGEIEPRLRVFRRLSGQQKLDQFSELPQAQPCDGGSITGEPNDPSSFRENGATAGQKSGIFLWTSVAQVRT
jgi:hypothetical protein